MELYLTITSLDTTAAYKILCELEDYNKSSCVIIKHGNPCGVAIDNKILGAYKKVLKQTLYLLLEELLV